MRKEFSCVREKFWLCKKKVLVAYGKEKFSFVREKN